MKQFFKAAIKGIILQAVSAGERLPTGRFIYAQIVGNAMKRVQVVKHAGLELRFAVPTALNKYRADTFSTKEPETLEWIDGMSEGAIVWDIGANVGLYSCYAALRRNCRVFSFEPSVFNLELLARNIFLNSLIGRVTIIPLPLAEKLELSTLNMTNTEWGGALSTFGQAYGHDGEAMRKVFEFSTIGLSIVDAVERLEIPQPDYIKMDVDGIEHLILKGGMRVLLNTKGALIEINDQFTAQAGDASAYMKEAGFTLKEKRHADYFDSYEGAARHTFNQIWVKQP